MRAWMYTLVVVAVVAGCAAGGGSSRGAARNRDLITGTELSHAGATNAYELVMALRPNWLITRGENSFRETAGGTSDGVRPGVPMLVIYLDNARLGGVETLRQILVPAVTSVRYFDAKAATFKWGPGHGHGAILVSTSSIAPPPSR